MTASCAGAGSRSQKPSPSNRRPPERNISRPTDNALVVCSVDSPPHTWLAPLTINTSSRRGP